MSVVLQARSLFGTRDEAMTEVCPYIRGSSG